VSSYVAFTAIAPSIPALESACLLIYQPPCSAPSPSPPPADTYTTPAIVTYRAWLIDPPCNVAGPDLGEAIGSRFVPCMADEALA
jgi:hypothetical protein